MLHPRPVVFVLVCKRRVRALGDADGWLEPREQGGEKARITFIARSGMKLMWEN